jgi:hypothetical protein
MVSGVSSSQIERIRRKEMPNRRKGSSDMVQTLLRRQILDWQWLVFVVAPSRVWGWVRKKRVRASAAVSRALP